MFLKKLTSKHSLTVIYCRDGLLQTCKGKVHQLDLSQQTLFIKDKNQQIYSISLFEIKEIC
ncbi:YolD-like family protein [Priestia filamentosa]|uniref:YolD-like family protein n=1 Tax=Priestia filamentosa TaxID=1402861 RepID=UPI0039822486